MASLARLWFGCPRRVGGRLKLITLQKAYDRFAPRYDEIFVHQQSPKIEALAAALPRPLPTPVLDLGAGTGLARRLLADDVSGPWWSVDASRLMLEQAAGPRILGDLYRLPLRDDCAGLALCVTALLDFVDPGPALHEMARVLRPGGWLALSVLKIEAIAAVQTGLADAGFTVTARLDLEQDLGFVCRRPGP